MLATTKYFKENVSRFSQSLGLCWHRWIGLKYASNVWVTFYKEIHVRIPAGNGILLMTYEHESIHEIMYVNDKSISRMWYAVRKKFEWQQSFRDKCFWIQISACVLLECKKVTRLWIKMLENLFYGRFFFVWLQAGLMFCFVSMALDLISENVR